MTTREIFNTAQNHLLTQKKKSYNSGSSKRCMYRGCDGRKCAIGIFIPDNEYSKQLESNTLYALKRALKSMVPTICDIFDTEEKESLGKSLQSIHDNVPITAWKSELSKLELTIKD